MTGGEDWDVAERLDDLDLAVRLHAGGLANADAFLQMMLVSSAPPVPDWFEPRMPPPPPPPDPWDVLQHGLSLHYGKVQFSNPDDVDKLSEDAKRSVDLYCKQVAAQQRWHDDRGPQRLAQWPWKYAELVLAARPKPTGGAA